MSVNSDYSAMSTSSSSSTLYLKIPDENHETKNENSGHYWNRREKFVWFFTLLFGTTAIYASRTTMPLVAPATSKALSWTKTEVGTILSCFFWGYTLTQILGGYLSDRFGPERVLLAAGTCWALLTFWFHQIVFLFTDHATALNFIVFSRVLLGAAQGVHFPALASISSKNLNTRDRSFFFSATTAGGALGTLLTGTLGSFMNENFGWPSVFYSIGFISLMWVTVLKYYAMELNRTRRKIVGLTSTSSLLGSNVSPSSDAKVPWLLYLQQKSLWACIVCHFCQNNCFFILLSWLPTYFHDNFPEAKSWIFNVVPWLLMVPGIAVASWVTNKLLVAGCSTTKTRKIIESICMLTEASCLFLIGQTEDFHMALFATTLCLFSSGFHNLAVVANPTDLAPKHSGSVFGVVNSAGAIPGTAKNFSAAVALTMVAMFACSFHKFGSLANTLDIAPKHSGSVFGLVNTAGSMSGFVGVYLAGYILEVTSSWAAVFNITALINLVGICVFVTLGSAKPIL